MAYSRTGPVNIQWPWNILHEKEIYQTGITACQKDSIAKRTFWLSKVIMTKKKKKSNNDKKKVIMTNITGLETHTYKN